MKRGKMSSQGRVTLPKKIREHLGLRRGDLIAYELGDGTVFIRKLEPLDGGFHSALNRTLDEWNTREDDTAFRDLKAINRNAKHLNEEAEDVLRYQVTTNRCREK